MASIVLRSGILSKLTRIKNNGFARNINRRSFSSEAVSNPSKEAIISAQSSPSDVPPITPPPEAAAPQASGRKSWGFLKYGLFAALTGMTGYAGYATYVPAKSIELYLVLRRLVEDQVQGFTEPTSDKLLPDLHPAEQHVFTLVLDLNETLLYTDWKRDRGWRTFKRPGVDAFLEHLGKFYEIVVYSDELNMYVDPVCDRLDPNHYIWYRLSRGATKYQDGKHHRILYVSGHAFESSLQPENCVPIKPYKLEADDTALLNLIPFLEYVARNSPADIRAVLQSYERKDVAKEFLERSKEYQRRMQEQRQQQSRFWHR